MSLTLFLSLTEFSTLNLFSSSLILEKGQLMMSKHGKHVEHDRLEIYFGLF